MVLISLMPAIFTMSHLEFIGGTKIKASKMLQSGDTIAIPNDTTNEARALLLLQDNGLLTLKDGASLTATINDIVKTILRN